MSITMPEGVRRSDPPMVLGRAGTAVPGRILRTMRVRTFELRLIAATLVELKARRLLPGREDVDLDDELALWEERDLLLVQQIDGRFTQGNHFAQARTALG